MSFYSVLPLRPPPKGETSVCGRSWRNEGHKLFHPNVQTMGAVGLGGGGGGGGCLPLEP